MSREFVIDPHFPRFQREGHQLEGFKAFCRYLETHGRTHTIVEVGSDLGESAELFAQIAEHLYCVDLWQYADTGFGTSVAPARKFVESLPPEQQGPDCRRLLFEHRLARFDNVHAIQGDSADTAKEFADESIDVVYIDAIHKYHTVKADILAWFPKVRAGGYVAGHDYDHHEPVRRAVHELLGVPEKEQHFDDCSWLFEKTPALVDHIAPHLAP